MRHAGSNHQAHWSRTCLFAALVQVYVNGEFVGGSDILMGLHKNGELEALFKNAGS